MRNFTLIERNPGKVKEARQEGKNGKKNSEEKYVYV